MKNKITPKKAQELTKEGMKKTLTFLYQSIETAAKKGFNSIALSETVNSLALDILEKEGFNVYNIADAVGIIIAWDRDFKFKPND